ncbi:MAG: hypothetical protein HYX78_11690 [Armatimonadetes bacterium]|nr:hypothetical protein [Armatimonadota bacterium]
MEKLKQLMELQIAPDADRAEVEELPIRVAEDWDAVISRANTMADVIDRHLEFESKLQGRELRPVTLCPEQKVSLVSDLSSV